MRLLFCLSTLLAAVAWGGETTLRVSGPDGLKGTATLVNKLMEDGSKYVRLTMKLTYADGQTADILQESSYTGDGEPVRMLQTTKNGKKKTSIAVTFNDEGAQVVADRGEGPKANLVVRPAGTTANPTELWFVKVKPKAGQTVEYSTFRLSEQAWVRAKSRYEGPREIVIGGKTVKAHLIQTGEIKSYVDEHGDPYRIELGALVLERQQ